MISIAGQITAQNIFVSAEQELSFGDFYFSGKSGGTVSISNEGIWGSTGNVHQINSTYQPAGFIISTDSRIPVKIQVDTPTGILTNAAGNSMSLELNEVESIYYSVQEGSPAQIFIGGTLKIGPEAVSSPGGYSGNISIRVTIYNE